MIGQRATFQAATNDGTGVVDVTWTFGDGTSATGVRVDHAWGAPGSFVTTAEATLADGRTVTETATVTVTADDPPPDGPAGDPVARITVTPAAGGAAPLTVTADATASTAGGDPIERYSIDFGDGTTTADARAVHTFTQAGDYTVTVTVTDAAGRTAAASDGVRVTGAVIVDPVARVSARAAAPTAPTDVIADASASTPGSNPITSYTFTFSDGTTVGPQAAATAQHAVTAAGVYTVGVSVRDSAGRTSTANASVEVTAATTPPQAALRFLTPPAGGAAGGEVRALDASASAAGSAPIVSYLFDFGDGTTAGPQPDPDSGWHDYGGGGTYTGRVTVTDQNGLQSVATVEVTLRDPYPQASLTKTVFSASPGGTSYEVTIRSSGVDTLHVTSITGQTDGGCATVTLKVSETCSFFAAYGGGSTSSLVTVYSDATNSPTTIDLNS